MPRLQDEAARTREILARERMTNDELTAIRRVILNHAQRVYPLPARARLSWRKALGAALAGAAAVAALLLYRGSSPDTGWRLVSGGECASATTVGLDVHTDCATATVVDLGRAQATLGPGSALAQEPRGVRLVQGRAAFVVRPAAAASPFEVRVSLGTIVVIGTRFTVTQSEHRGMVRLEEGSIEFRWDGDHEVDRLNGSGELSWPRPPRTTKLSTLSPQAPPPPPPPPRRAPAELGQSADKDEDARLLSPRAEPVDPRAVMQRIFQLRSQGRFDDAVALLQAASTAPTLSPIQRELFGFELGNFISRRRGARAACRQWRAHLEAYPQGPHAEFVQDQVRQCDAAPAAEIGQ